MSFPQTRQTLIQRLTVTGTDADWRDFVNDYWGPICRFALRQGNCNLADAEDVASQTFEVLIRKQLLTQWISNRSAKLRTLLCTVVRNIISNRARVEGGRARLLREQADELREDQLFSGLDATTEQVDAFYQAWVEELLQNAVEQLLIGCHQRGKGDHFRVLYGRICEELKMTEIAESLSLPVATVENYFKAARKQLGVLLEKLVRQHVDRYSSEENRSEEFAAEWARLGEFLRTQGGLEVVIRRANDGMIPPEYQKQQQTQIDRVLTRILPRS